MINAACPDAGRRNRLAQRWPQATLYSGGLLWVCFAPCVVLLRGVRLDEAFERAQVLAGSVPYPADHPLYQWSAGAFTIFHSVAAYFVRAGMHGDAGWGIGFYQESLHLMAAMLPVYVLVAAATRKALPAHLAVVLILLGAHLEFDSYYPLSVWPDRFTIAHIGLGYALLVLAAWLFEWRTLAAFMTGCMPMIHLGLAPPFLLLGGAIGAYTLWHGERRRVLRWAGAFAVGLLLCMAFAWLRSAPPPLPSPGSPYYSASNAWDAYTRYTQGTDVHRAFARFGEPAQTRLLLLMTLFLSGMASCVSWPRPRVIQALRWLTLFSGIVMALYYGALLVQPHLSGRALFLAVGWMPHRLPNLLAPVLIALVCALAVSPSTQWPVLCILLWAAFRPLLGHLLPGPVFERYIAPPELLLFLLAGIALYRVIQAMPRTRWTGAAVCVFLVLVALHHQMAVAMMLTGGVLAYGCQGRSFLRRGSWYQEHWSSVLHLALLVLLLIPTLLAQRNEGRNPDRPEAELALASYTHREGVAPAMILAPCWFIDLQMYTGQPVFATYETQAIASYMPHLAASIEQMYTDVYGYRFGTRWDYNLNAWATRSAAEWRALGKKYDLALVLAPMELQLPLAEVAVKIQGYRLYRLDAAPGEAHGSAR